MPLKEYRYHAQAFGFDANVWEPGPHKVDAHARCVLPDNKPGSYTAEEGPFEISGLIAHAGCKSIINAMPEDENGYFRTEVSSTLEALDIENGLLTADEIKLGIVIVYRRQWFDSGKASSKRARTVTYGCLIQNLRIKRQLVKDMLPAPFRYSAEQCEAYLRADDPDPALDAEIRQAIVDSSSRFMYVRNFGRVYFGEWVLLPDEELHSMHHLAMVRVALGSPIVGETRVGDGKVFGSPVGERARIKIGRVRPPGVTNTSDSEALKGETGPQSTIKGCREVFFVTDRQSVGTAAFGDGPSDKEEISYGRAVVSIPLRHQLGEVERPWRVWVIELPEKADRHVMIASREPLEAGLFHAAVEKAIDRSPVKSTFVFIHGYNVSFDEAVLRTGQLAWDLKFRGPAVSYCWPSRGDVEGYLSDIEMAEWTVPHLKRFLRDLRERTKARRVHLVAHSMGGRVLTRALQQLSVSAESINTRFQEVVLAAPDLNAKILSQLAGAMQEASDRVTIYSSGRDLALQISAILRGESSRAGGKSPSSLKLPASFDVIDATKVRDSLLGHSYFVTSPLLLNDLALLIIQGLGPDDRAVYLERSGPVWVFR